MNAERLLALYEKVAEAPDAIGRLRRFVLDLAVRGKLVEQDLNDEPASKLLQRIAAEKARLVKAGALKDERKPKEPPSFLALFELPQGWAWINLQSLCMSISDGDHQPPPKSETGVPFLVIGDVRTKAINYDSERRVPQEYLDGLDPIRKPQSGDLLYTLVGSFGIPIPVLIDEPFCIQRHIAILRPSKQVDLRELALFLESEFAFKQAEAAATGIAQKTVSLSGLRSIMLPLPPLAEQRRIVAKVEELMGLLDRMEAARKAREATRDRMTAASLTRLIAPDTTPEVFPAHARFALDALPALTTRRDQVKSLRQTILNLAVRGKLVEQDPNDEPASEFLKRIAAEKARLAKAGEICATKALPRMTREQLGFTIPLHWEPLKLSEMLDEIQTGPFGSSLHQSDYVLGGTPVINPASLQNAGIVPIDKMAVGPQTLERLSSFMLRNGDIVMARRGEMGRCALVTEAEAGWLCGTGSLILRPSKLLYAPFLVLMIGSPFSREYLGGTAVGTTMQNLNQSILLNLPLGLPSFAEQHRIVAKIEALMTLCARLETALATTDTTKQRLLEALLHEALEPTLKEAA